LPFPLWRQTLQPASFNGVPFHVEVQSKTSGRRIVPYEFPKQDVPQTEDMGRRIRRFVVTAYIIYSPVLTPDYEANRDDLIAELESEGPGLLILPTGLQNMIGATSGMVVVDHYSVTERREQGGYVTFEITFMEAGSAVGTAATPAVNTQGAVTNSATSATTQFQNSSDIVNPSNQG
jgi:prophage DNA circulation protein